MMSKKFVICINNKNYEVSLEIGKVYQQVEDRESQVHELIRILDESGEDYLFPKEYFVPITVPQKALEVLTSQ